MLFRSQVGRVGREGQVRPMSQMCQTGWVKRRVWPLRVQDRRWRVGCVPAVSNSRIIWPPCARCVPRSRASRSRCSIRLSVRSTGDASKCYTNASYAARCPLRAALSLIAARPRLPSPLPPCTHFQRPGHSLIIRSARVTYSLGSTYEYIRTRVEIATQRIN